MVCNWCYLCSLCLNAMDPYCGWDSGKNRCSPAPNGDPSLSFWKQDVSSCPVHKHPGNVSSPEIYLFICSTQYYSLHLNTLDFMYYLQKTLHSWWMNGMYGNSCVHLIPLWIHIQVACNLKVRNFVIEQQDQAIAIV